MAPGPASPKRYAAHKERRYALNTYFGHGEIDGFSSANVGQVFAPPLPFRRLTSDGWLLTQSPIVNRQSPIDWAAKPSSPPPDRFANEVGHPADFPHPVITREAVFRSCLRHFGLRGGVFDHAINDVAILALCLRHAFSSDSAWASASRPQWGQGV